MPNLALPDYLPLLIAGTLAFLGLIGLLVAGVAAIGWIRQTQAEARLIPQAETPGVVPPGAVLFIEGPERIQHHSWSSIELSIGRTPDNDLMLPSPTISRQHALIQYVNNQYVFSDLKSSNGVLVNGKRISRPAKLKTGDVIEIEPYKLTFRSK